jgi:predicted nucleic acid-binding protein
MSGLSLLVDTNILVYLTAGNKNIQKAIHGNKISVSFITEMELLSWPAGTQSENRIIKEMLGQFKIVGLTEEIKSKAIEIRR